MNKQLKVKIFNDKINIVESLISVFLSESPKTIMRVLQTSHYDKELTITITIFYYEESEETT